MRYLGIIVGGLVLVGWPFWATAQVDTTSTTILSPLPPPSVAERLDFSAYLETYYAYDLSRPVDHTRSSFIYAYHRHHEVALNLGLVQVAYTDARTRAKLGLMAGTYANANLAAEPGVLKNIFEATAGVKLHRQHDFWLDAGIFSSHIGFESAIGDNCWTLTRSLAADNSPYYEAGIKATYVTPDGRWLASLLLLNGWQQMQRTPGDQRVALGHQLTYTPNATYSFNSSSYFGSSPDSDHALRFFHNFYATAQVQDNLAFVVGVDYGAQRFSDGRSGYQIWYSPLLISQYQLRDDLRLAARLEYYSDPQEVVVRTAPGLGFQTFGYSVNVDYQLTERVLTRAEVRGFSSREAVFSLDRNPTSTNGALVAAIAVRLD